MKSKSVHSRLAIGVIASFLRSPISFLAGLLTARALGPKSYGDYVFLIAAMQGIRQFLDLGTSNAFYTFLCQRPRDARFVMMYIGWQGFQLAITVLVISVLLPKSVGDWLWLGYSKTLLVGACLAVFAQLQLWQTFNQVGDSLRETRRVQIIFTSVTFSHLSIITLGYFLQILSIPFLFCVVIGEYTLASLVAFKVLPIHSDDRTPNGNVFAWHEARQILREFTTFCSPLIAYSIIGALQTYADSWLLQRFGGAINQAYFSVSSQLAAISLLMVTAMQNVFWKEMAESHAKGDRDRLIRIYEKGTRLFFAIGLVFSCFLIPWAEEITILTFGKSYAGASRVFAMMLIYPVYQALNLLPSTFFLATGRTWSYFKYGVYYALISLPISYVLQAPSSAWLPGLELGATGMALKTLIMGVLSTNYLKWQVSKYLCIPYRLIFQPIMISIGLSISYLIAGAARVAFGIDGGESLKMVNVIVGMGTSGAIYLAIIGWMVWRNPSAVGMSKEEFQGIWTQRITTFAEPLRKVLWG